jgi:tetratricopeptide (TPR) repeat protein
LGRLAEASDEMERARELEPGSRSILADQSLLLYYQGKSGQAIDQLHRIEAAEPAFRSAHLYLAYIYFVARDCRDYLDESRKAAESSRNPVELAIVAAAQQGFIAAGPQGMLENLLQAQKKFADDGRCPGFQVAETFAMLGRKREALEYLNSSYKNREIYMVALNVAPTFASLRTEPEYRDLVARLGLDGPN